MVGSGMNRMLAWLILAGLMSGCHFYGATQNLSIRLPRPPHRWDKTFDQIHYTLQLPGNEGLEEIEWPDNTEVFTIEVEKTSLLPVIAIPEADGINLPPAGGLYPLDEDGHGVLDLSWRQGLEALLMLRLAAKGMDPGVLDIRRLRREIQAAEPHDPWLLDTQSIIEGLAAEAFRVTDIKHLASREVPFDLKEGTWFTESPFSPAYKAEPGSPLTLHLTYGYHNLFSAGSDRWYELHLDEREILVIERTLSKIGQQILGSNKPRG